MDYREYKQRIEGPASVAACSLAAIVCLHAGSHVSPVQSIFALGSVAAVTMCVSGLCTVVLKRLRLTTKHFIRLFRDCAIILGLVWLGFWCILQAGTSLSRQSIVALKATEPILCTLLMKKLLKWKLPELYIPATVSITAGLLLYSQAHLTIQESGLAFALAHSSLLCVSSILLRNAFLEQDSLLKRSHFIHLTLIVSLVAVVGALVSLASYAASCAGNTLSSDLSPIAECVDLTLLPHVASKQLVLAGFRFILLLSAIFVLRHYDVCRVLSFQCLSLAVLSSQSLVVNDSLPQLFGVALACSGLVALFSGVSSPRPSIVKHPNRCAWLPSVCAVALSNTCYEAVDENPNVGACVSDLIAPTCTPLWSVWASLFHRQASPHNYANNLLAEEFGGSVRSFRQDVTLHSPGSGSDIDDSSLLDSEDVMWLERSANPR